MLPINRHVPCGHWREINLQGINVSDRVCQDGCEAYRLFGTPDDFALEGFENDLNEMSFGVTAWRAIAFAIDRGLELPLWLKAYLRQTARGVDAWAMLNRHPSELKEVLQLQGKRKLEDRCGEPRWIYSAICQLREQQPGAPVKALVLAYMKQFPRAGENEEYVRQKYYQGKKLADTGVDYKGRGRSREMGSGPLLQSEADDIPF